MNHPPKILFKKPLSLRNFSKIACSVERTADRYAVVVGINRKNPFDSALSRSGQAGQAELEAATIVDDISLPGVRFLGGKGTFK